MMSESTLPTAHASAPGASTERPAASAAPTSIHTTHASVSSVAAASSPRQSAQDSSRGVSEPASPTSSNDQATPSTAVNGASGGSTATVNGGRKRVFTFQKRWLHSLPIMEKVLSDSALDAASVAALKAANLLGDDGKPVDDAAARDVIVCMLCDDPNSTREMLKIWSRVNCRRGRIENHLMSKHPEFMLLLKNKRDAEGDLAVQIFLKDMREGRCNVHNEISAGLYSHVQPLGAAALEATHASHKRAFGQEDFMMPASATTAAAVAAMAVTGTPYQVKSLESVGSHKDGDDEDGRRKRAKSQSSTVRDASGSGTPVMVSQSQDDAEQQCEATLRSSLLHASLLSYHGPAAFTQWRSILTNKMIVITGGENAAVARAATNLWLLGANILITFAELNTMEAFATSYLAQFHAMEGVEPPRGVMLPLFCSLHTRAQIDEWSRSIAAKFEHVDLLINYVDQNNDEIASAQDSAGAAKRATDGPPMTSKSRSRAICEVFSATCMQRSRRAAIINMNTQTDNGLSSSIEAMTTNLANELYTSNVQVNCLVVEPQAADSTAQFSADQDLSLLHSILFLLSPASNAISGSVLRQRRSQADSVAAGVQTQATATTVGNTTTPPTTINTNAAAVVHSHPQPDSSNGSGALEHEVI